MSLEPLPSEAGPARELPLPEPAPASFELGVSQRLDPRSVPCERIAGWIRSGVLLVLGSAALVFYWTGRDPRLARLLFLAGLLGFVVLVSLLATVVLPRLAWKHASWRLFPLVLEIRRGILFRHLVSVPRARVQHTDVERGPIERRFGLATLVVHTAGHDDSEIRLEGLEHGVALALRDRLLKGGGGDGA
jgi:membrane protein YdbS with pleckstrin-like domain